MGRLFLRARVRRRMQIAIDGIAFVFALQSDGVVHLHDFGFLHRKSVGNPCIKLSLRYSLSTAGSCGLNGIGYLFNIGL